MDDFREKGGKKAAKIGIIANTFLTILNISVGLMSGSYALISKGGHTLSDIATTIIAYIGFKIGQKPADPEHPFGYGRAEAICGLVIMLFLTMVAYEVMSGAVIKLVNHSTITTPDIYAAGMAFFGIFINYVISKYIIKIGKDINSPAIIADGQHQKTDIFSSVAILIGIIVSNLGFPILDPIIGLVIGFFIIRTAFKLGKENIDHIMGKVPSEEFIDEIRDIANNSSKYADNAHNIKVDYLGSYAIVALHVEVDGNMTVDESHKIVHIIQDNITDKIDNVKYVNVHACPKGLKYNHDQEVDL